MLKKTPVEMNRLSHEDYKSKKKKNIIIILDNIRSMHNVGAAFRVADAFLIEKVILCGITASPPRKEITKTALGAEENVSWEYFHASMEAIKELKNKNYEVVAIEQAHNSVSLENFSINNEKKYALVFGHEVNGINDEILKECNSCCEITQYGMKHSLNISVALGIVCWKFSLTEHN